MKDKRTVQDLLNKWGQKEKPSNMNYILEGDMDKLRKKLEGMLDTEKRLIELAHKASQKSFPKKFETINYSKFDKDYETAHAKHAIEGDDKNVMKVMGELFKIMIERSVDLNSFWALKAKIKDILNSKIIKDISDQWKIIQFTYIYPDNLFLWDKKTNAYYAVKDIKDGLTMVQVIFLHSLAINSLAENRNKKTVDNLLNDWKERKDPHRVDIGFSQFKVYADLFEAVHVDDGMKYEKLVALLKKDKGQYKDKKVAFGTKKNLFYIISKDDRDYNSGFAMSIDDFLKTKNAQEAERQLTGARFIRKESLDEAVKTKYNKSLKPDEATQQEYADKLEPIAKKYHVKVNFVDFNEFNDGINLEYKGLKFNLGLNVLEKLGTPGEKEIHSFFKHIDEALKIAEDLYQSRKESGGVWYSDINFINKKTFKTQAGSHLTYSFIADYLTNKGMKLWS